ncbi:hypothetical protein TNCV_4758661 [Trichonephila clavipes]|nr:hypothetical protein TNCV_4758661 [Trichonephila clavipes]
MPRATECENKRSFVNILVWFPDGKHIGTTPQHLDRPAELFKLPKMFQNCRKEHLRIVALEFGETVAEKLTIVDLIEPIKENKYFKEDGGIQYTIEDRKKAEEDRMRAEEDRKKKRKIG